MFIPNWVNVYGSNHLRVTNNLIHVEQDHRYSETITISKSGLKAMDQPSERCDSRAKKPSTSLCISKYIEKQVGCSMNIQGHRMSNRMLACNSTPEYSAWKNISMVLEQAESNPIYKMTGGLASCQKINTH